MNKNQVTTATSKQRHQEDLGSRSQCDAATLVNRSDGFLSLLLLALLCFACVVAYDSSLEVYEAFTSLPVRLQFAYVTWAALFAVGFAATVREVRKDWLERWSARVVGAAGVALLVGFSYRMTVQVDQLQTQITAQKEAQSATGIGIVDSGIANRNPRPDASITTRDGHVISVSGRSMSDGTERPERPWERIRRMDSGLQATPRGENRGIPMLSDSVSAKPASGTSVEF